MFSKFSVKKPYTVVVGIIMVLILGFVSFSNMTTDLLPNINLPYAVIMTTYQGASPETVEEVVTKPIEQVMARVSNIENIASTSSENTSVVTLEFSQTTNMDSVSLEMREYLDQISGYWGEEVGKPIILKLNPDMMPIMVTAIQKSGLKGAQLTDYVDKEVISSLESLEGVASVSASGKIEEGIDVIIRQEKIDEVNKKVEVALNNKFDDAQKELDDAKAELEDGEKKLEVGKKELDNGISQGGDQMSKSKQELESGLTEINGNLSTINTGIQALEIAEKELKEQQTKLDNLQIDFTKFKELNEQKEKLEQNKSMLEKAAAELIEKLKQVDLTEEQKEIIQKQIDEITKKLQENQTALDQIQGSMNAIGDVSELEQTTKEYIEKTKSELASSLKEMQEQKGQLEAGKTQLVAVKEQLEAGKISLSQAETQMNQQQISASIEMATAKSQLESGKTQLEQGQKELDTQKEKAIESADISKKITADMVSKVLMAQNFSMPAGYVTEEGIDYLVRVGDKLQDTDNLESLVLFDMDMEDLDPITLSDVADVVVRDNSSEVFASINGEPGVVLTIQKQTGYSTGEVSKRIKAFFDEMITADKTLDSTILMDQGVYIDVVVDSVLQNMLWGGILAIIILLLFLRDLKPTIVVAFSIPISILAAIVLMYFSGVTLNIISLSGLALGVGMLVDNSIVVIENIYRMRSLGVPVKKSAIEGAKQVTGAIIASTLTTVCVFAPIVFTQGITRQLFVDMGLTIAYSLLASLIVALTVVPMMSAGLLKNTKEKEHKIFDRLQDAYGKLMKIVLRFKPIVLILAILLLVLSMVGAIKQGTAFMPEMESAQTTVYLRMKDGTSMEDTGNMANEIVSRLSEIEDIEDIGAMSGGSGNMMGLGGGSTDTNKATLYLILNENRASSSEELVEEIESKTKDLDCEIAIETSSMDMSALGGSGITVEIKGKDLDKLQEISKDIAKIVTDVEGTTEVLDGINKTTDELRIVVNKGKASKYNLTVAQVFQQISAKLEQEKKSTTLSTETKEYSVAVSNEESSDYTRDKVKTFTITATNAEGKEEEVPIEEIVDFVDAQGLQAIKRDAQTRYINVTAGVDEEHNIGLVAKDVERVLKKYDVPEGYKVEMKGEDQTINESMTELMKMLGLAVLFMYLIMVAQFQSLLSPFIVMFTIPLAFTGGFLGLLVSGSEVSVIALIGFVMLSGIIVNNGIVLVDYTNQLRAEGLEKKDAIIEAGKTRMRPIMMTALTTILGLSTMAMGMGMGSSMVQPMAIVTIGGLIYGTVLTLFVVPCIYDLLNRKKYVKWDENEASDIIFGNVESAYVDSIGNEKSDHVNSIGDGKSDHVDSIGDEKNNHVDSIGNEKSDHVDSIGNGKSAYIDSIGNEKRNDAHSNINKKSNNESEDER